MESKRHEATKPFLAHSWAALLAVLWLAYVMVAWINAMTSGTDSAQRCRQDPHACEGEEATVTLAEVREIGADGLVVLKGPTLLHVRGTLADVTIGDDVSFGGRYRAGGVEAGWMEVHPLRPHKRILGVVGLAVCLCIGFGGLRWRRGGLVIRG